MLRPAVRTINIQPVNSSKIVHVVVTRSYTLVHSCRTERSSVGYDEERLHAVLEKLLRHAIRPLYNPASSLASRTIPLARAGEGDARRAVSGPFPPERFTKVIDEELAAARPAMVAQQQ